MRKTSLFSRSKSTKAGDIEKKPKPEKKVKAPKVKTGTETKAKKAGKASTAEKREAVMNMRSSARKKPSAFERGSSEGRPASRLRAIDGRTALLPVRIDGSDESSEERSDGMDTFQREEPSMEFVADNRQVTFRDDIFSKPVTRGQVTVRDDIFSKPVTREKKASASRQLSVALFRKPKEKDLVALPKPKKPSRSLFKKKAHAPAKPIVIVAPTPAKPRCIALPGDPGDEEKYLLNPKQTMSYIKTILTTPAYADAAERLRAFQGDLEPLHHELRFLDAMTAFEQSGLDIHVAKDLKAEFFRSDGNGLNYDQINQSRIPDIDTAGVEAFHQHLVEVVYPKLSQGPQETYDAFMREYNRTAPPAPLPGSDPNDRRGCAHWMLEVFAQPHFAPVRNELLQKLEGRAVQEIGFFLQTVAQLPKPPKFTLDHARHLMETYIDLPPAPVSSEVYVPELNIPDNIKRVLRQAYEDNSPDNFYFVMAGLDKRGEAPPETVLGHLSAHEAQSIYEDFKRSVEGG